MDPTLRLIPVQLDDETTVLVQVSGEAQELRGLDEFPRPGSIVEMIKKVAEALRASGDILGWTKTSVSFEVAVEASTGIPFLASGKATGTLSVTMDFEKPKAPEPKPGG